MKLTLHLEWRPVLRWLIAAVLVWAALGKLANLQEFYTSLLAYRLPLPTVMIGVVAIVAAPGAKVDLVFSGGHETDPRDRGRPVVLIAAALNVPPEVFRDAFTHVHPAPPGQNGPTDAEARANKQALMSALGPYGVTDDRLNTVSNYYRYRRDRGEMWPTAGAQGYATVQDGAVTSVVITNGGSGYSSPPSVSVAGMPAVVTVATLGFSTEFSKNGSVASVAPAPVTK